MWVFLAAVSGAIIGGVSAIVGGWLANRVTVESQNRLWLADSKLKQRAQTAERLRKLYARLVQSTVTFQTVAAEKQWVMSADGDEASRDARHAKELNAALGILVAIGGKLLVDKDAKPMRQLYNDFRVAFDKYLSAWQLPPGTKRAKAIHDGGQEVSRLALEIQEFAENQLDELNAPPSLDD